MGSNERERGDCVGGDWVRYTQRERDGECRRVLGGRENSRRRGPTIGPGALAETGRARIVPAS